MPDVGTLNIKIESDAEKAAAGLGQLATKLRSVKQNSDIDLTNVQQQITNIVNAVVGSEKTMSSLGTLFNAVSGYYKTFGKLTSNITINTEPIKQLKESLQDGFSIGQSGTQLNKLREALEGEWKTDNAYQAGIALTAIGEGSRSLTGASLGKRANEISAIAHALDEFAISAERVNSTIGGEGITAIVQSFGQNFVEGMAQGIKDATQAAVSAAIEMTKATLQAVPDTQDSHSPSKITRKFGNDFADGFTEGVRDRVGNVINEVAGFVQAAISSSQGNTAQVSQIVAASIRSAMTTALGNVNLSEAQKNIMEQATAMAASFTTSFVATSKQDLGKVGEDVAGFVRGVLNGALNSALQAGSAANEVKDIATSTKGAFSGTETVLENVGTQIQTVSNAVGNATNEFKLAKPIIASTLKEFSKAEKTGVFSSWMYGPKQLPETRNMTGSAGMIPDDQFKEMNPQLYRPEEFYERMAEAAKRAEPSVQQLNQTIQETANGSNAESIAFVDNMVKNASEIDLVSMKIEDLKSKLYEGVSSGKMSGEQISSTISQIQTLTDKYNELVDAEQKASSFNGMLNKAWSTLNGSMQKMFPTITSMIKRFGQIVKYRMLRTVLRHITSGFTEGIKNVYQYSKAVGTDLAPAMDQAATVMQQMKNSLGAAAAPLIQALVPALQTIVSWFINLINYANQFFALLNGQNTWTRALPEQAEAFEKSTKSAKGASKAMKDLLADWDELNIIQSQSGNGGGSGTGKTAEEYKNMFEEVSEFSDRVKSVLNTINESLGGLTGILKKAGLLLLGWKFSKAFEGFLGTLGTIIAGGALVTIGVELAYGSGFSAGSKGRWDPEDIIGAIGGAIASAIGGSLITTGLGLGGGVGFAIGLTAAALVTLIGYVKGQEDLADKEKWGDLTYTQDQINEFIKKQFTFERDAEIRIMSAHISDTADAKRKVKEATDKFSGSLSEAEQIVADVNTSKAESKVAAVKKAAEDAQNAIIALQQYIDTNEKGLTYTLTNFKFENAGGEDVTDDILSSIKVADKTLREFFSGEGEKLAKILMEGEKSGWKNGEMEQAVALMESQKRIFDRAEELRGKMKFETETKSRLRNIVDRDTALTMLEEQKKALSEYEETTKEMVIAQADNLFELASIAESAAIEAGLDTDAGKALHARAQELTTDAERILGDIQGAVDRKLKETKENMAKEWAKTLFAVYGGDIDKSVFESTTPQIDWLFSKVDSAFAEGLRNAGNKGEFIAEWLKNETRSFDPKAVIANAMNEFGMNLWDLLSEDARKSLFINTSDILGDSKQATEAIMTAFGITKEQVKPYLDNYLEYVDKETDNALKNNDNAAKGLWAFTPPKPGENPVLDGIVAKANATVVLDEVTFEFNKEKIESLKRQIEEAMVDGLLTTNERSSLEKNFGAQLVEQVLQELQYNLDEDGYNRGAAPKGRMIASAGVVSDVGYGKVPYGTTQTGGINNQTDLANGVAAGTERGNASQNSLLQQLISICTQIAQKEFTVNVTPSSDWGRHNSRSNEAYDKVTG